MQTSNNIRKMNHYDDPTDYGNVTISGVSASD